MNLFHDSLLVASLAAGKFRDNSIERVESLEKGKTYKIDGDIDFHDSLPFLLSETGTQGLQNVEMKARALQGYKQLNSVGLKTTYGVLEYVFYFGEEYDTLWPGSFYTQTARLA